LGEQGQEPITAWLSCALEFDDIVAVAATNNKIGTGSPKAWAGLNLPPASAERLHDRPLKRGLAK